MTFYITAEDHLFGPWHDVSLCHAFLLCSQRKKSLGTKLKLFVLLCFILFYFSTTPNTLGQCSHWVFQALLQYTYTITLTLFDKSFFQLTIGVISYFLYKCTELPTIPLSYLFCYLQMIVCKLYLQNQYNISYFLVVSIIKCKTEI